MRHVARAILGYWYDRKIIVETWPASARRAGVQA